EQMIALDIQEVNNYGDTFFSATDTAYLIFMIIGIIGYFTVPSVANYIVHAGGGNTLLYKVTSVFSSSASSAVNTVSSGAGMVADSMGSAASKLSNSLSTQGSTGGYFQEGKPGYMQDKLSGK
ncbi:MAG: conjugative transposon protein TraJ, partial [Thermoproteota archaeon]|nr:conjugative transposon protein TraJ [Thermoproteota archaeon]